MDDKASSTRLDLLILGATVLVVALIDPRGNFPLSDDWSYAYTTRMLCETGRIEFLPWTGASVVFQAGYGALLCKLGGFSFTVLRLSTIVLAAGGAIALNHLLTGFGVGRKAAALAVAATALNPLYLSQSFTFMTDVPFTALALIAAAFYAKAVRTSDTSGLVVGSLAAAASILIRQHGVFVVAAAVLAIVLDRDRRAMPRLRAAIAAGALPALTFIGFHLWLFASHGTPAGLQNKMSEVSLGATVALVDHAFRAAATLGLAVLPLTLLRLVGCEAATRRLFVPVAALFGLGAAIAYANDGAMMFYLPNVQYDFGLGASTLRDAFFLAMPEPFELGAAFTIPLTVISLLSAGMLAACSRDWPAWHTRPDRAFIALTAVGLFLGSLLHGAFYFDRYLIPVIPFTIVALLLGRKDDHVSILAIVVCGVLSLYAVAGTHDYMEKNRARFAVIADAEAAGIDATRIDGGFEYNAWRSAHVVGDWPTKESAARGQSADTKSWWWVQDDEFVVSSSPLSGYRIEESRSYSTWLSPGSGRILLLVRDHQS